MAAEILCPRALAEAHSEVVVVKFPKSLRTRCGEFCMLCGQLLLRVWDALLAGIKGLMKGGKAFSLCLACVCGQLLLRVWDALLAGIKGLMKEGEAFSICLAWVILGLAFYTAAYSWIILIITARCHSAPGIALTNFTIRDLAALQSVGSTPDSPWQVNSAFDANFSTWNRNTVAKCFTTYRRMDVRVEYKGHIILQQQFPLEFSLKPLARRPFSIEMKSDHGQLPKDLGAYMQAELRSDNITLTFFHDTRYLIADRRSKWESNVCVVVSSSRLGTMLQKNC